ncbi:MAG TPA: Ig-like domain-containing protein [Blastocatellia bacterium]|nr:Ig-like domain-containing protein [Blastocatellia bacterium]
MNRFRRSAMKSAGLTQACILGAVVMYLFATIVGAQTVPGLPPKGGGPAIEKAVSLNAVTPSSTESGQISLSIDGLGTLDSTGTIQVNKPAGATVRKAFLAAASTGFSGRALLDGDVKIEGTDVAWSAVVSSSILSTNAFADVTSIVKPIIDAAPAGINSLTITEVDSGGIDGEILAVIFDDPNQTTNNTVIILFGAQNTAGDNFNVLLAEPIADTTRPIDMSLGISFGFQPSGQFSLVDVNGNRLTTSAGGQDDGDNSNGALLTVGGIGDLNTNPPDPFATDAGGPRTDDELYDLRPFVQAGDTTISVFTRNPSGDDNILFAAFFFEGATAIIGEGIVLGPDSATNPVGTTHTVTATLQNDQGQPIVARPVAFEIISGPNVGLMGSGTTDSNGQAQFTYTSFLAGTDQIVARFTDSQNELITSNTVTKTWEQVCNLTCPPNITVPNTNNQCGAIVSYSPSNVSGCGTVTCAPPSGSFFPVGTTTVTCQSAAGPSCSFTVTVQDVQSPVVHCSVGTSSLWPPNHNLINVGLAASASDNCGGPVAMQVLVFGDEDDEEATGDGMHSPDAKNIGLATLRLRSERKGDGDGRVYLIVVKATDASGNVGFCVKTVVVPHSQNKRATAAVQAQAAAAAAFAQANGGAPPPGYFVIGDGPILGPKQ